MNRASRCRPHVSTATCALTALGLALAVAGSGCGSASATSSTTPAVTTATTAGREQSPGDLGQLAPLVFQGLRSPIPFTGSDGKTHLSYTLTIQNAGPVPVKVNNVTVLDGDDQNRVVASYSGTALSSKLGLLASPVAPLTSATLKPNQAGAFWVDVALDDTSRVPTTLMHRITATPLGKSFYQGRDTVTAAPLAVSRDKPADLVAPLAGDRWIDLTGCCNGVPNHRHALFSAAGQLFASQEFAIDFMRLDSQNRLYVGKKTDPASYVAYGAPVLAVSDATVVAASDHLPDQVPGSPKPVPPADADGNFVMLDLGDGRYANYAHLKPGSVTVQPGDRVTAGQRLGLVGNSGQTGAPHLHFHVMDRPLLAEAVGLPYQFKRFDVRGVAPLESVDRAVTRGGVATIKPIGVGPRENELPLELTVLDFP